MIKVPKRTISKISLPLLLGLCLGLSSTLYATKTEQIDDEKEDIGLNASNGLQNEKKQFVADWSCPKCTFLNKGNSKSCAMCYTSNPLDDKHAIWTCAMCTFNNLIDNQKCAMCESLHPLLVQQKALKHNQKKLPKDSPIDVKFISYTSKKDKNKQAFVLYRFKVTFKHSACEMNHRYTSLHAIHQHIIKTYKLHDKSLTFPPALVLPDQNIVVSYFKYYFTENNHTDYLNHGKKLQRYLVSLLKHQKTDNEDILYLLGIWVCDRCQVLNSKKINKKCIKCKNEQLAINVHNSRDNSIFDPFTISMSYANDISLNDVLDKTIQHINSKKDKKYYIDSIASRSFIEKRVQNRITSTDNHVWNTLVHQKITTWRKDKIINKGLAISIINRYHHTPTAAKISCTYIKYKDTLQYSGLHLALRCPLYRAAMVDHQCSKTVLNHLKQFCHFWDGYHQKPVCQHHVKCKTFIRIENNGHAVSDLCHMEIYRHPPRTNRQIKINENVNKFICNQNDNDNQPLYKPNNREKSNLCRALLDEVIKNGYKHDLCLICQQFVTCTHNVYKKKNKNNLISCVESNFNHNRYKQMGSPFHSSAYAPDALMLSLILYTGCDCNYDLCKAQRNGNYRKWKIFDFCLWNAIYCLSEKEYGAYKLYSGLENTKLSTVNIRSAYFPTYTSTTVYKEIAEGFMGKKGMIIEIDPTIRNAFICCDVSWLSKFPDEHEILAARTVQGKLGKISNTFSMKLLGDTQGVQTVRLTTNHGDVIPKIACMIRAETPAHAITPSDVSIFNKLIAGAKNLSPDLQKKWATFRYKQQTIKIDIQKMYRSYNLFAHLLFSTDPKSKNLLLLDKIVDIFPNVAEIICGSIDYLEEDASVHFSDEDIKDNLSDSSSLDNDLNELDSFSPFNEAFLCFIFFLTHSLPKIAKHAKLKKIIVQTNNHEIEDTCNLYATHFSALGWHIQKTSRMQLCLTVERYDDLIAKISAMIRAEGSSYEVTSLGMSTLEKLFSGANDVPAEAKAIWDAFRHKQQTIKIDMRGIYAHYTPFIPLLFSTERKCKNLLLLDKIAEIFPNASRIVFIDIDDNRFWNKATKSYYSPATVDSNFMLNVKNMLSKVHKNAKLKEVVITATHKELGNSYGLSTILFGLLGWQIKAENTSDSKTKDNQETRTTITFTKMPRATQIMHILYEEIGFYTALSTLVVIVCTIIFISKRMRKPSPESAPHNINLDIFRHPYPLRSPNSPYRHPW